MAGELRLDVGRIDVEAARDDDVLAAVDEDEKAAFVEAADVACPDEAGLRLSSQLAAGTGLRPEVALGIVRSVRHPHLHGEHGGTGNAGRLGWHWAAVRRYPRERPSSGRDMFKRPSLRRSRARRAKRRPGDPRRGLPWLLADRRDQLRERESVLGSSAACSDDARPRRGIIQESRAALSRYTRAASSESAPVT